MVTISQLRGGLTIWRSSFLSSPIVEIIAEGSYLKRFQVHSGLLYSKTLWAKPNVRLQDRALILDFASRLPNDIWPCSLPVDTIDGDTVTRVVEFLYTEDYTWPPITPAAAHTSGVDERQHAVALAEYARRECSTGTNPFEVFANAPTGREQPLLRRAPTRQFGAQLLCHARIYVLGFYVGSEELCALALGRLLATLRALGPAAYTAECADAAAAVEELCRYVYRQSTHAEIRRVRDIVATFVVNNEPLLAQDGVRRLLATSGDFAVDVVERLMRCKVAGLDENRNVFCICGAGEKADAVDRDVETLVRIVNKHRHRLLAAVSKRYRHAWTSTSSIIGASTALAMVLLLITYLFMSCPSPVESFIIPNVPSSQPETPGSPWYNTWRW